LPNLIVESAMFIDFITFRFSPHDLPGGRPMHISTHSVFAGLHTRLAEGMQPVYSEPNTVLHHMSDALQQSFYRVLALLIAILPGLLALFVAVALFTLIGMGLSGLLRRALRWMRFDDRLTRRRSAWTPSSSPTELVARCSFWGCVILGLLVGVSAFDAASATAATSTVFLLPSLKHLVGAILVLLFGTIIARFLARSVLISAVNAQLQYARFLSLGVKWLVLVLTAAMVLDHLEIGGRIVDLAFGIVFGGIVLTLALAVGLGSRDIVSRSLENQLERTSGPNPPLTPPGTGTAPGETLRHF
jgi:hypothetical protein